MGYKEKLYDRVCDLLKKSNVFNGDTGYGIYLKKHRPFILDNNLNNLYPDIVTECIDYFDKNDISWWQGSSLTNHPLSSQVACLNHLFPIRKDRQAVLDIIQSIDGSIVDVLKINSDKYQPAYVSFETVSDKDYLNEGRISRGNNCTSVDALVYGFRKNGEKILFLIEWKYTEKYGNENLALGTKGVTITKRYDSLINNSKQLNAKQHNIMFYEPFYQLMRQTLWAEQMIANKNNETVKADDFIHIHVVPTENTQLLNKIYKCSGNEMEATWRSCIHNQKKYIITSPQKLMQPIDANKYNSLLNYLEQRYW